MVAHRFKPLRILKSGASKSRSIEIPEQAKIIFWSYSMANEKQPRGTAAKRTTTPRTTRAKSNDAVPIDSSTAETGVPVTEEPVSTAQATVATARNAVIEGNATVDLDDVRRRAYELYESRGRQDGHHEQDWYTAEQEVGRKSPRVQAINETKRTA
jgi:hypothetical protein